MFGLHVVWESKIYSKLRIRRGPPLHTRFTLLLTLSGDFRVLSAGCWYACPISGEILYLMPWQTDTNLWRRIIEWKLYILILTRERQQRPKRGFNVF